MGYTAATIRESTSAKRLAERQRAATLGELLGRAGVWGNCPQLFSNLGVHTNRHRLFDSVEH
jgi:hypothetical protein